MILIRDTVRMQAVNSIALPILSLLQDSILGQVVQDFQRPLSGHGGVDIAQKLSIIKVIVCVMDEDLFDVDPLGRGQGVSRFGKLLANLLQILIHKAVLNSSFQNIAQEVGEIVMGFAGVDDGAVIVPLTLIDGLTDKIRRDGDIVDIIQPEGYHAGCSSVVIKIGVNIQYIIMADIREQAAMLSQIDFVVGKGEHGIHTFLNDVPIRALVITDIDGLIPIVCIRA